MNSIVSPLIISLLVSISATITSFIISFPIALYLYDKKKNFLIKLFQSFMSVPTVLVGLFFYLLLSRHSILGFLNLLYTPLAIYIGETFLILPLMTMVIFNNLMGIPQKFYETLNIFHISRKKKYQFVLQEIQNTILHSNVIGFSRAISEIGVALILGGNIEGYTRNLTTAIAFETRIGNYKKALILGIILFIISFLLNYIMGKTNENRKKMDK